MAGSRDLAEKVRAAFEKLNEAQPLDQRGLPDFRCTVFHPQSATTGSSESLRRAYLESNDLLIVADTLNQIQKAKGSAYHLLLALQQSSPRASARRGRFVLFKDEADSMLRTRTRELKLERAIDRLEETVGGSRPYSGAQAIVNISATLMPVFLEMQRTQSRPSGPVFFTSVPSVARTSYSGVESFQPLTDESGQPQYLDPKLPRNESSLGIDETVVDMFTDMCD